MYEVDEDDAVEYFRSLKIVCPEMFRSCWRPEILELDDEEEEDYDEDFMDYLKMGSKFGGNKPFRTNDFQWPNCDDCSSKKSFLCQINIGHAPSAFKEHISLSSGLLQVFYCFKCKPKTCFKDVFIIKETEFDFFPSLQSLAAETAVKHGSVLQSQLLPKSLQDYVSNKAAAPALFEEKVVGHWSEDEEIPESTEFDLSLLSTLAERQNIQDEDWDDFVENLVSYQSNSSVGSDLYAFGGPKIGGWINWWVDGVEFPKCPDCGVNMDLTFLSIMDTEPCEEIDLGPWLIMNITLCPSCSKPGLQMHSK